MEKSVNPRLPRIYRFLHYRVTLYVPDNVLRHPGEDSPTQRCNADVVGGPECVLRTQGTFPCIYGHVQHIHVCAELEDKSPDKSQYVSYISRYVLTSTVLLCG